MKSFGVIGGWGVVGWSLLPGVKLFVLQCEDSATGLHSEFAFGDAIL